MTILAVQENGENITGSTADLYLELKKGTGRVFLDTYPLTRTDTQISTRFAKEIACKYFTLDCNTHDFIFTIRSNSNIIGGPSAGAAMAALTTIAMLDLEHDPKVAITGTINSGAIVGPVGGVKEKIDAAARDSFQKVLISKTGSVPTANGTVMDFVEYGKNTTLEVEVFDLNEILFHLTGERLKTADPTFEEDKEYSQIMQKLASTLCVRSEHLRQELGVFNLTTNVTEKFDTRMAEAINASGLGEHYSAASYCFTNNIQLRQQLYHSRNLTHEQIASHFEAIEKKKELLTQKLLEEKMETISDLQTFLVVSERMQDLQVQIDEYYENETAAVDGLQRLLGYAEERFFSGLSWIEFFSMSGREFIVDEATLRAACIQKVSEAEQRYQYATQFIPTERLAHIWQRLNTAKHAEQNNALPLCLMMAVQAKGDSNIILSTIGVHEENLDEFFDSKKRAVERVIAENTAAGMFPILGYSYYQYANSLRHDERYVALLYLEYALEMSDLTLYFPEKHVSVEISDEVILVGEGILIGVLGTLLIIWIRKKK